MGATTNGYLSSNVDHLDIKNAIENVLNVNVTIENGSDDNFNILCFDYRGENRRLNVIENVDDCSFINVVCTSIIMGFWGHSTTIIKALVENFGGYYLENDYEPESLIFIN